MTKTIAEAANEYAANWEAKHNIHNPELYGLIVDAYKASAERIMSLPLAQRLTAEEKERVRKMYIECELIEMDDSPNLPADRITEATAKIQVLESIFGTDFFKEGE